MHKLWNQYAPGPGDLYHPPEPGECDRCLRHESQCDCSPYSKASYALDLENDCPDCGAMPGEYCTDDCRSDVKAPEPTDVGGFRFPSRCVRHRPGELLGEVRCMDCGLELEGVS